MPNVLDLFTFRDYRSYLLAWLEWARKTKKSNLSHLAKAIGVHTSYLGQVVSGRKNLSGEQATELSEVLHHTELEQEYFFCLIALERAGTTKFKKYWSKKIEKILNERNKIKSRVGIHAELSAEDRAIFYSSWLYAAVFTALSINDGQSLNQIADYFHLTRSKAEEILAFLIRIGVAIEKNGIFKSGTTFVFISNDSPLILRHHSNWRIKAIEKMDMRTDDELFFTAPMSFSKSDFLRIREILSKAIETSLEICRQSPAKEVVCLNIDLFRV